MSEEIKFTEEEMSDLRDIQKTYVYPKRIDRRTKKYGNQRKHKGEMGKYN